jgi:lipopolysaccharide transport system permease protein
MSTPAPARIHRVIRPSSGFAGLDWGELWAYRDLLLVLAARDVKLRYRQTALGAVWVLFQPLVAAGIFTLVFGVAAGISVDGVPFFAYVFAGQMAWQTFANTLTKTANSLVQNSGLVSKVYFPRLALPLSAALSSLVDFGVMAAALVPILLAFKVGFFWGVVLLPVWFVLIALMALGVGLMAGALMVSFRDVQYIVPVALQTLMFASPVVVPVADLLARVGEKAGTGAAWQSAYFLLNPLAALIEGFHWSLFGKSAAPAWAIAYAALVAVALFVGGALVFRSRERQFADVI